MKPSPFSEEPIADALRHVEAGTAVAEGCRKLGVSEQTCSRGKRTCAGIGIAEWRRLRQLEDEHRKLKPWGADLTLDQHLRQEVIRTKRSSRPRAGSWWSLCESAFMCVRDGRATWSRCIARPRGTGVSLGIRRPCAYGFAIWPRPRCATGIAASTSGARARAGGSITNGSTVYTGWKGSHAASSAGRSA